MATKISDRSKKPAGIESAAAASVVREGIATEYLGMRIHQFLVSYGEAARLGDIGQALAEDGASVALVRHVLLQHPSRFMQMDRRWDVRARYLDRQRPISKLLEEVVASYDAPIAAWDASHELGAILGRSAEGTRPMVERLLKSSGSYAPLVTHGAEVKFGLKTWLLDTTLDYTDDANLLFYNFLPANAAAPYAKLKLDWENDPVAAALAVIEATPGKGAKVVDNRLLLFLAYKQLDEDFAPNDIFNALANSERLVLLPSHRWTNEAGVATLRAELTKLSSEVAELPEEDDTAEEESTPLSVSAEDLDEMFRIVSKSDFAVSVNQLLQDVYDSSPGERTYNQDLHAVTEAVRSNPDRFQWVGYDRFRAAGSLPAYIGQVPENLLFPVIPQIPDPNEDLLDQLLEDEGFERGLDRDIRNPAAMDVNDQDEPATMIWPNGESAESRSIRLVLKAHHKEIGTFPLCQIPVGFITSEPPIVELTLRDARGAEYQVFADHETQLIYGIGLFDLYSTIVAESGAIFSLERTPVPGELRFVNNNESDEDFYIAPERLEQLQNYRGEIEEGPTTSTHDIVRYILEHSNSAMSYLSLLAEVNVVRRTNRRLLASILSGWPSFVLKGGLWTYDTKKTSGGFNKNKRKYII